ncbi:MAG TPA: ABC transporter ATP-binding protein [Gemmatimonadales bacterium]|jgi:oligopeptide/dipeptide ABC transporter ATP-binding protein|nr:ABC transporter ATP-binding protein [Gemmatimonadales bacterium]
MTRVLEVDNLRVSFPAPDHRRFFPVDGVSFTLDRGETLALVGESGCGKSLTSLALLQLVPPPGRVESGSTIRLADTDVLSLEGEALRRIRGRRIGMIFQDPMTSLNPVFTVGDQIAEGVRAHLPVSRAEARERARTLLQEVGIPDPSGRLDAYPHQLSGGMRQRVMIAIALAAEPEILVADEPTTALDVTVQAQILEVLDRLRRARGMAVLLITHDLGIVAGRADRVAVMYAGQIVEEAPTPELFAHPSHPYTQGLFASVPRISGPVNRLTPIAGTVPPATAWPAGCRFRPRCPQAFEKCQLPPELLPVGPDHRMRCWLAEGKAVRD